MDSRKDQIIKVSVTILFAVAFIPIIASAAWAVTDVYVTDIYTPLPLVALQDTIITAELTNYGDDGDFYLYMYIDGYWVGTWQLYMAGNSWATFSVTITGGLTAGYHTIEFCADYCRAEGWTWTGAPDLQLTDIYPPSSLAGGDDTTITARIDNIGNADAGPFWLDMYIDGQYVVSWDFSSGLPAMSYGEVSVTLLGGLVAGAHSIEFIADVLNEVPESNEGNNNRTETFTWTGTPDLELTDIYDPSSLLGGQDSIITAKITNIGYADAGPFWVDMYIDGQYVVSWDFSGGLPAMSYGEVSVTLLGGLVDGTHDIEFIADALNEVAESNEINNERTESWTWSGGIPDLELTDIYDPTSLVAGEDTVITARTTNIGYAEAGSFNLEMFIDDQPVLDMPITSGLPAWYYLEANITVIGGFSPGEHCIKFYADYYNSVSESNEGNNERTECFTWTANPPDPPTGVSAVAGPGSGDVTISWNLSSSPYIDYYRIYQGTTSGFYDVVHDYIPEAWNTGTILSGLTNDVTYYFAMTAVDTDAVESSYSNETSAMPVDTGDSEPPTDPANLSIIDLGTGTELQLNWNASTDNVAVSHYMVFRLTNNSSVSEYNYDSGFPIYTSATSFIDYDVSGSNTYYYRVLAVDTSDNWSGLSNLAWDTPDDNVAPSAPINVGVSAGDAVVDLWWTAPTTNTDGSTLTDLAGYNIYRGTSSGVYDPTPINGSYPYSGLSYTDTNVINGQTYYYVIKAVDDNGNESPASIEVSDTPDVLDEPPSSPANLSITEKETELLLTWDPNYESDLAGYNVYRGTISGSYTLIASNITYEWYLDQNVVAGQTYYYVVTAKDNGSNESGYSNEVSGMIGQGDIWIIEPTSSSPATLDFAYQTTSVEGEKITTAQTGSSRIKIRYDYDPYDRLVSEIYLEIINSDTREVVYTESEWNPPLPWLGHEPYFIWDGKYSSKDECVPDGWYDTRLYLKVFDFFGSYAETVEKRSIYVVDCGVKVEKVFLVSNASGSWSDNSTPSEVASSTDVDLRAVIKVNPAIEGHYYFWGFAQGTATVDGQSRTVYQWNNAWGEPAFDWNTVEPVYNDYDNTTPSWHWDHLYYTEKDKSTAAWELQNVGGSDDVGTMRYTIDVTWRALAGSPGKDDIHQADDYCILDSVMRINVKGNYSSSILQWAAAYINVPFIMGSNWPHQVERYIGTDCADLAGRSLQRVGSDIENDPSAQSLYNDAVNNRHGLIVITSLKIDDGTIPQPQPGDIVLFELNDGDTEIDHTTIFVSGSGDPDYENILDIKDITIYASSDWNRVKSLDYSSFVRQQKDYSIAVIRYTP